MGPASILRALLVKFSWNMDSLNSVLVTFSLFLVLFLCRAQAQPQQLVEVVENYPAYLQNPTPHIVNASELRLENLEITQRSLKPSRPRPPASGARRLDVPVILDQIAEPMIAPEPISPKPVKNACIYDKNYFARLDECLARKPYPTVGLPAFKNEDLLVRRSFSERHGCLFILSNGLFKNYQISRYAVESDTQCLDGSKVGLSFAFSNVTLAYLWNLRCLNRADQLLDDATLDGKTLDHSGYPGKNNPSDICVGSSQNLGFASLQLNGIEAQVELFTDLFKNWRVTNITMGMINAPPSSPRSGAPGSGSTINDQSIVDSGTNIKEYVFESLDGDELNWRYLLMFKNWSRNRMHVNFLDQYRRFLWISLQRCLVEATEKIPTKLVDVFTNQRYN